jgi:hypothetical protein
MTMTDNPFTTLSPEQLAALPGLRDKLSQAFKDAVTEALTLGGTGVFHIAGQPRIAIEAIRQANHSPGVMIPIELTGVPGGPVYEFYVSDSDIREMMMAMLKAQ